MNMSAINPFSKYFNIPLERFEKALSLTDGFENRTEFFLKLNSLSLLSSEDILIQKALAHLDSAHFIRENYYPQHAQRVAGFYIDYSSLVQGRGIVLGLLHNILEVTACGRKFLTREYGSWMSSACGALTLDRNQQKKNPLYLSEYYRSLEGLDVVVMEIKIFDKLDNLLVLFLNPSDEIREQYLKEIEIWLLPLIEKTTPYLTKTFLTLIQDIRRMEYESLERFLRRENKKRAR